MILRVLISRSALLTVAAVAMLAAISVIRLELAEPGIMLLAVAPIALLGMMYGTRGGLAGAGVASAVFLIWAFRQGHPGVVELIDEPVVFFLLGLLAGIYAHGALGGFNLRRALQLAELRSAIQRGEVSFHYQPLVHASTHSVVGFEALARWEHPVRGRIEPAEFVALAEHDQRTIWELTLHTVDRTLGDLASWGELAREVTIFVNVSSVTLTRPDLGTAIVRILDEHGFPASRLGVEITETALIGLPARAVGTLDSLKRLGMEIVLDDFGTGYSSITRLGRLPFDTLKVDLRLIGLPPARDANRILRAMIELARALGLRVVVEGVEDDQTWSEVSQLGGDLIQGFRLSRPLPADAVPNWLAQLGSSTLARLP